MHANEANMTLKDDVDEIEFRHIKETRIHKEPKERERRDTNEDNREVKNEEDYT